MDSEKQLQNWLAQLDEITAEAATQFGTIAYEALHRKPNPNMWSIAENLAHLMALNSSYYPVWRKARDNQLKLPWFAGIGFIVKTLGKVLLQSVQPDRKRKIKTFPIWEPVVTNSQDDVMAQFKEHQVELKAELGHCQSLIGRGVVIHSPANSKIVYTFEDAVSLIIAHERRHLVQASEVLALWASQRH